MCVCAWARALAATRHLWLECWGVCVCLCARSAYTMPLLAGVCDVGLCAWARVSATPRHSRLGCSGVCVPVCALRLYPATPGWGVRCGRVCFGSGLGYALPLLAGVLACACVFVCIPLVPRQSWLGCAVWLCVLGLGFWSVARHSWLGCWGRCAFVCALSFYPATPGWDVRPGCVRLDSGFGLRPATPGWAVGVGVCLCVRFPLLGRYS